MRPISTRGRRTAVNALFTAFAFLFGNSLVFANDAVGERIETRIEDLERPFQTPSVGNSPVVVERAPEAGLRVPAGFEVNAFAEGLNQPRWMAIAPNGDVFLTEKTSDDVILLRDSDGDGAADLRSVYLTDLHQPHGLAFHDQYLYIGEISQIRRVRYERDALEAAGPVETVTALGSLGDGGGHWPRNIVFAPDDKHFFVTVGSLSNRDVEPAPRATVQRFAADGSDQTTFASGLRNPVGIAFYPGTDDLYVVVNERDGFGDDLVPDYFTRVEEGGFYGWPFVYLGRFVDPKYEGQESDALERTLKPDLLFKAHSAPLGLVFYDGGQFPEAYIGDAFVAFHGSWNASVPTGYKVVRVPFENGRPLSFYENFAVGFRTDGRSWLDDLTSARDLRGVVRWVKSWFDDKRPARVWGRPVGLAVGMDGSLLIADDISGTIWRISYTH